MGWSEEAGFFEELRVQVVDLRDDEHEIEGVLRVSCYRKPERGRSWDRKGEYQWEEDMEGLEGLQRGGGGRAEREAGRAGANENVCAATCGGAKDGGAAGAEGGSFKGQSGGVCRRCGCSSC